MNYYIVKTHHNDFKAKLPKDLNINILVNNFIKRQNKGEAKSDRIHLKSISKITEEEYDKSILFDESYKII